MARPSPDIKSRALGELTFEEVGAIKRNAVLCLPMGSMEQHGPHLPLNTDTVLAETLTDRIVQRWGKTYDLWRLPPIVVGLSREHDWAAGTLSLSVAGMTTHLRDLARAIVGSLPCRNLLIVNGHGGNRGILEALGRELQGDFGLNLCALHLGAMMSPAAPDGVPDIHAGFDETSVMLAVAPDLVRRDRLRALKPPADARTVRAKVLDPSTTWPWTSEDRTLARSGVIGDARNASAKHGEVIVSRVVEAAGAVLQQLRDGAA